MKQKPNPPEGYTAFRWKNKIFNKGCENEYSAKCCPQCGEFGFAGTKQGFTDKFAMTLSRAIEKGRIKVDSWNKWLLDMGDGQYLRDHWSR